MAQTDLALQKLDELRQLLDDDTDTAELVDTLATLLILKQDVTDPMFGAKVTLYQKPEGEWTEINWKTFKGCFPGDLPLSVDEAWEKRTDSDTDWDFYEQNPWWLRWQRYDGDNHTEIPEGEHRDEFYRYTKYGEKEKIDGESVPDPLSPDNELGEDIELAEEMPGEWSIYEKDFREYRHTPLLPCTEFQKRRAIVVEPHIADQPSDTTFWDPHKQEYTTPDEYPMGTVNVVVPEDTSDEFGRDYTYEMEVVTSVMPADGDPSVNSYTPGWTDV